MDSNKVQWLQKLGIDVWRPRTVDRTQKDYIRDEPAQESDRPESPSSSSSSSKVKPQSHALDSDSPPSTKSKGQVSKQDRQSSRCVQVSVSCSFSAGLLLIKDDEAMDREFTEDVLRAYRLLKGIDGANAEVSFFGFNWPEEARLPHIKGGNDTSLEGAQRAFLAKARNAGNGLPGFIVAVGKKASQLASAEIFDEARVLHCVDESDPSTFKKSIWTFLRDDQ
ncbi:MAG: hypothetical protein F4X56_01870 [Gammaproteobacteria bacterium]|nr:hypothetical protein [Gammaproteobacteria bacterium]MYC24651.1 hypothetical protein [Gammaproteobacteria bacterium]